MKICGLCQKIIRKNDDYKRVTDYSKGKQILERFYHRVCWKDRMSGKKLAMALAARTGKLLNLAEQRIA